LAKEEHRMLQQMVSSGKAKARKSYRKADEVRLGIVYASVGQESRNSKEVKVSRQFATADGELNSKDYIHQLTCDKALKT
jgi:hypothetical protein